MAEESVPQKPGAFETRCPEALADAAFGVVRKMKGVVAPEGAVVVPEVVVWIVWLDADGCCLFHGVLPFGLAPGIGTNKKPPIDQERRSIFEPWRFLLFWSFDPLIAWVFQASHRGSFSNSSVGTLRL